MCTCVYTHTQLGLVQVAFWLMSAKAQCTLRNNSKFSSGFMFWKLFSGTPFFWTFLTSYFWNLLKITNHLIFVKISNTDYVIFVKISNTDYLLLVTVSYATVTVPKYQQLKCISHSCYMFSVGHSGCSADCGLSQTKANRVYPCFSYLLSRTSDNSELKIILKN